MIFLSDPFAPFPGQPAHAMLHGLVQDGLVSSINYPQRLLQTSNQTIMEHGQIHRCTSSEQPCMLAATHLTHFHAANLVTSS